MSHGKVMVELAKKKVQPGKNFTKLLEDDMKLDSKKEKYQYKEAKAKSKAMKKRC